MFTLDNILIIFIVIIILVVYRRFDVASKSHAKLNALLREARSSMEELVQNKIASLRDVGIEVDAQRQAAQTILGKARDIGDAISQYEPKVGDIQTRIERYESLLPQLMRMTQSVEKNMTLIQDESEYVDTLGKRLKENQKRLQDVEQTIQKLVARFEASNASKLKEIESRFLTSMETEVSTLREVLESTEQRVDASESRIIQAAQDIEQKQEESVQQMQEASEDIVSGFGEKLLQVSEPYETKMSEQQRVVDEEIERLTAWQAEQVDRGRSEMLQLQQSLDITQKKRQEELEELFIRLLRKQEESEQLLNSFSSRVGHALEEKEKAFSASLTHFSERYAQLVTEHVEKLEKASETSAETSQSFSQKVHDDAEKTEKRLQAILKSFGERSSSILSGTKLALDELAREGVELKTKSLESLQQSFQQQIDATSVQLQDDVQRAAAQIQERMGASQEHIQSFEKEVNERLTKVSEDLSAAEQGLTQEIAEVESGARARTQASIAKIEQDLAAQSQGFKDVVEERIHAVKASIETYYGNLHTQFESMQAKTNDWRETLEDYILKLEQRLAKIDQEFQEVESQQQSATEEIRSKTETQLQSFQQEYQQTFAHAHESMESTQTQLQEMKGLMREEEARISAEVKERSQAMLSELSSHIHATSEQTQESILKVIDAQLSDYESDFSYRVSKIESITVDMDNFENSVHDFIQGKKEQVFSSVEDIEKGILGRYQTLQQSLEEWGGALQEKYLNIEQLADEFRERAQQHLETRIGSYDENVENNLRTQDAAVQSKLSILSESFDQSVAQLKADLEQQYRDIQEQLLREANQKIATVHTSISERMTEGEMQVNEFKELLGGRLGDAEKNLQSMGEQIAESIGRIKKESYEHFSAELSEQKMHMSHSVGEWQGEVTQSMSSFKEGVEASFSDIEGKILVFGQRIDEEKNQLAAQSQKYRDLIDEGREQAKEDIDEVIQSSREEFLQMRGRLLEKLEQDLNVLAANTEKIEKKQKLFLEQTRLFERVDVLKQDLEATITVLKGDMDQLKEQRKWLRELGAEMNKMQRVGKETDQQFSRFLAEKRRIDMLEANYNRLVELSYAVEQKLQVITSKDDEIQTLRVALKNVSELEGEVEERFSRLEQKKQVLDVTIEGVQKNFSQLGEFDEQLDKFSLRIEDIPEQIQRLSDEVSELVEQSPRISQAITATDKLDTVLGDLEERIEKLQLAREWVAGVETRLSELNLQLDGQLRSFQQLVKEDLAPKDESAPSNDARRTVIQLSRQGWNVEEISRVTKISRGEVELILEMSDRR